MAVKPHQFSKYIDPQMFGLIKYLQCVQLLKSLFGFVRVCMIPTNHNQTPYKLNQPQNGIRTQANYAVLVAPGTWLETTELN